MPFPYAPYVPFDPRVGQYGVVFGQLQPLTYTGWKDLVLSWKKTVYIHGGLNPSQACRVTGPDALRMFSEHCVNSFAKFSIGAVKHAVMCNDDGLIQAHGVLIREDEEQFLCFFLIPWLLHVVNSGDYDVETELLNGESFLFQVAGPRSLETLEAATGDDLSDIKFLRSRKSKIAISEGREIEVTVIRVGMAGSLAYEMHGPLEFAHEVYNAIVAAGEQFEIRKLGWWEYLMNHTENGFPQGDMHFLYPWYEDYEICGLLAHGEFGTFPKARGSADYDMKLTYRNPFEVGWGNMVKFDHEFQGRAALEKYAADPKRKLVTLVWNPEDILDIYRSYFQEGEEFEFMEFTHQIYGELNSDLVMKDDKVVGISSGRTYSYYYRKMISLCTIDIGEAEFGNEVSIVWGEEGKRQKRIRATVDRYPMFNEGRNNDLDVTKIERAAVAV